MHFYVAIFTNSKTLGVTRLGTFHAAPLRAPAFLRGLGVESLQ